MPSLDPWLGYCADSADLISLVDELLTQSELTCKQGMSVPMELPGESTPQRTRIHPDSVCRYPAHTLVKEGGQVKN